MIYHLSWTSESLLLHKGFTQQHSRCVRVGKEVISLPESWQTRRGDSSLRLSLWCQTTLVGTWGQPNKVKGALLGLAEHCWEPPCVMVRGLGGDDSTKGFHRCVNGRFTESALLYDLLPFCILLPACHYKAWNYCEPHLCLTNTKSVVSAPEDSTFFQL